MPLISKRPVIAWAIYDWASSAFSSIITTFIFATYFTQAVAKNTILGTAQWGEAIAIAGLTIAIISPIFGAIADYEGRRKPWLATFTGLAIIAATLLWFVKPDSQYVMYALLCLVFGTIGIEVAFVFYNSMMHDLVPEKYLGRLSGLAWGLGYAGGLVSLIIMLFLFIRDGGHLLGLNMHTAEAVRISGPFTALWYLVFALPLFFFTPDKPSTGVGLKKSIKMGLQTLGNTLKSLKQYIQILKFLLARMLYIDGLNTLFAFGGIYAAGTFGMHVNEVVKFGISMNISAGIGAATFAWIDDFLGAKTTILISLVGLISMSATLLFIHSTLWFWTFAIILGLFVGPVQAASRSLMSRIAPPELMTEMFGLYALSGKVTAFLGPWLLAFATLYFQSQRAGMSMIVILLCFGAVLLCFVKVPKRVKTVNK